MGAADLFGYGRPIRPVLPGAMLPPGATFADPKANPNPLDPANIVDIINKTPVGYDSTREHEALMQLLMRQRRQFRPPSGGATFLFGYGPNA